MGGNKRGSNALVYITIVNTLFCHLISDLSILLPRNISVFYNNYQNQKHLDEYIYICTASNSSLE